MFVSRDQGPAVSQWGHNLEMCSIDVPLLIADEDDLSFENSISKPIKEIDFTVVRLEV